MTINTFNWFLVFLICLVIAATTLHCLVVAIAFATIILLSVMICMAGSGDDGGGGSVKIISFLFFSSHL